jgi:hypothetical protein
MYTLLYYLTLKAPNWGRTFANSAWGRRVENLQDFNRTVFHWSYFEGYIYFKAIESRVGGKGADLPRCHRRSPQMSPKNVLSVQPYASKWQNVFLPHYGYLPLPPCRPAIRPCLYIMLGDYPFQSYTDNTVKLVEGHRVLYGTHCGSTFTSLHNECQ